MSSRADEAYGGYGSSPADYTAYMQQMAAAGRSWAGRDGLLRRLVTDRIAGDLEN